MKIVGVHGVGHQYKGAATIGKEWGPALNDGLALAGHQLSSDADFICAFYGDLFRPSGKSAFPPRFDSTDVTEEWELELLDSWWREAARVDPAVHGLEASTKLRAPRLVQHALNALSQSAFFAGVAERALIFDLKQVYRYLHEAEIRDEARNRIVSVIDDETRVIVAHSLGSIVAYEALCANPHLPVEVLVTLGSPLGVRNLIFDALEPTPCDGWGIWPAGIEHWINIADSGDLVALVKQLGSCFDGVLDLLVNNGARAHEATRYLNSKELGDAVALGL